MEEDGVREVGSDGAGGKGWGMCGECNDWHPILTQNTEACIQSGLKVRRGPI